MGLTAIVTPPKLLIASSTPGTDKIGAILSSGFDGQYTSTLLSLSAWLKASDIVASSEPS